jgi:hypothetical protein
VRTSACRDEAWLIWREFIPGCALVALGQVELLALRIEPLPGRQPSAVSAAP